LTGTGKQRIYLWNSIIGEAKMLLDDGDGTISSIEYDTDESFTGSTLQIIQSEA
jgi:hypothetical protein